MLRLSSGEKKVITRLWRSTIHRLPTICFSSGAFSDPSGPSSEAKSDVAQPGWRSENGLGGCTAPGLKCCPHAFLSKGLWPCGYPLWASVSVKLREKSNNCITEWLWGFNEAMHVKCIGEFLAHGGLSMNGKQQKQQQQQRHHQYLPNDLASGEGELRTDALSSTQLSAIYGGFANGIHDSTSVYVPSFILQLDHQDVGKDTAVIFTHSFIQKIL